MRELCTGKSAVFFAWVQNDLSLWIEVHFALPCNTVLPCSGVERTFVAFVLGFLPDLCYLFDLCHSYYLCYLSHLVIPPQLYRLPILPGYLCHPTLAIWLPAGYLCPVTLP